MCHWVLLFVLVLAILLPNSSADTLVQLHVNRPYNDVNENFVSFALRPEDLYDVLDGSNRKAVTSMAAMLGDSYIKFVGDFYFATNAPTRLRNPTKIIWKGFNRWTRAVNWTMIIPVPYAPDEWDSMHTLKILNTSYMVGITDCIWQLGTDFGTSRAKDYVQELNTLKLMSDTFKSYVDDWRVMGADISAGSSPDETRRYVDMSKDVNAAFGWTQPANMLPASSLGSYIFEGDPALKALQQQNVPIWLTLPQERVNSLLNDETTNALRWAQTLGDAASSGFDVIFKKMSKADFERPNFSFYVTAVFKKVMGSRVFPARPLNVFAPSNKLYTHCANDVSGGLAFMVVNTENQPTTITVRSQTRLSNSEIHQYILTGEHGRVMLNNVKLSLNSTLRPLIKSKESSKMLQLITPSMSVGFWVLPSVNLEHCQYSEIEAEEVNDGESSERHRNGNRYSSADRLLQRLIEETSVSRGTLQSAINRRNRRFVLDNQKGSAAPTSLLGQLLKPFQISAVAPVSPAPLVPKKRQSSKPSKAQTVRPHEAFIWLHQVMEQARNVGTGRSRRAVEGGPFFYNKHGKKTTLTKKITEIRKPERKVKPLFDLAEFDEEEFFKKISDQPEPPAYTRLPEGDVHLKHIETVDGEEESEPEPAPRIYKKRKPKAKQPLRILQRSQEQEEAAVGNSNHERRRMPLLPTEFFEPLPAPKPNKHLNLGATLNSLLFPEPFSNKNAVGKVGKLVGKLEPSTVDVQSDVETVDTTPKHPKGGNVAGGGRLANDFVQAQRELGKRFLSHINEHEHEYSLGDETTHEGSLEAAVSRRNKLGQIKDLNDEKPLDFFGTREMLKPKRLLKKPSDEGITSWWDLPARRRRRALPYSRDSLPSNAIDRDEDMLPLGHVAPGRYALYEYKVELPTVQPSNEQETETHIMQAPKVKEQGKVAISEKIVSSIKSKVSSFMNIISRHMSEWYQTLAKHLESGGGGNRSKVRDDAQMNTNANAISK